MQLTAVRTTFSIFAYRERTYRAGSPCQSRCGAAGRRGRPGSAPAGAGGRGAGAGAPSGTLPSCPGVVTAPGRGRTRRTERGKEAKLETEYLDQLQHGKRKKKASVNGRKKETGAHKERNEDTGGGVPRRERRVTLRITASPSTSLPPRQSNPLHCFGPRAAVPRLTGRAPR